MHRVLQHRESRISKYSLCFWVFIIYSITTLLGCIPELSLNIQEITKANSMSFKSQIPTTDIFTQSTDIQPEIKKDMSQSSQATPFIVVSPTSFVSSLPIFCKPEVEIYNSIPQELNKLLHEDSEPQELNKLSHEYLGKLTWINLTSKLTCDNGTKIKHIEYFYRHSFEEQFEYLSGLYPIAPYNFRISICNFPPIGDYEFMSQATLENGTLLQNRHACNDGDKQGS